MNTEYSEPKESYLSIGQAYPAEFETKQTSWKINKDKWETAIHGAWFKFGREYDDAPYLYFTSRIGLKTFIAQLLELDVAWQCREIEIEKEREHTEAEKKS